jgi:hypothetical protein
MSNVRRPSAVGLVLLLSAAAACGPKHRGPALPPAEVIFSNQALDQADVYAVSSSGGRMRIGTVMAGRTDTLRVPSSVTGGSGTVTIIARILARSITPSTGQVTLLPGNKLAVTLPPDERMLTVLPVREP